MNHETFFFLGRLGAVSENNVTLLKHLIFNLVLFMLLPTKTRVPVHFSVCTKKLINIKMRKLVEFLWDFPFLNAYDGACTVYILR